MQKFQNKVTCITGCLILTVLLFCGCSTGSELVISSSEPVFPAEMPGTAEQEVAASENPGAESAVSESTDTEPADGSDTIYVQVTGAVRNPGVYELKEGARVFEAVQKAGGMTDDAAPESVNQAVEVTDGTMVVLCTRSEWEARTEQEAVLTDTPQESSDGRVNINTADLEQLCTIPGIGRSRAESIVTYREQNGAFRSIEDIMKVSGIKDGLFQKIKDRIKV